MHTSALPLFCILLCCINMISTEDVSADSGSSKVPVPPVLDDITKYNSTSIFVSWSMDENIAVDRFEILYSFGSTNKTSQVNDTDARNVTLTGLVPGELYDIYIISAIGDQVSAKSNNVSQRTSTGVLIVGTEWWPKYGDIPGYIIKKSLVKILQSQKYEVYMTVFDPSEAEKIDAQQHGIHLIEAQKITPEKLSFTERLLRHKFYFPNLEHYRNVTFIIVGFVTVDGMAGAARSIHDEVFPHAHFVFILSYIPEELDQEPSKVQELEYEIMEYVEKATFTISIGPKVHSHFTTKFNALENKPEHIEYLPAVYDEILNINMTNLRITDQINLLTFDFSSTTVDQCTKKLETIALASGKVANYFTNRIKTNLKIRGLPEQIGKECQEKLLHLSASPYLSIVNYPSSPTTGNFLSTITRDFKQCHLHLTASKTEPFGVASLLASAAGVPSLSTGLSGFAQFIKRNLTYYYDTVIIKELGINQNNDELAETLKNKCIETLVEPILYETFSKKTKGLQKELKKSMENGAINKSYNTLLYVFNEVISKSKQGNATTKEPTESENKHNSTNAFTGVLIQIDVKVTKPANNGTPSMLESCENLRSFNKLLEAIGSRCQRVKRNSPLAISVSCPTMQSVEGLWDSYKSDFLLQVICLDVLPKDRDGICDKVIIETWRYRKAKLELNYLYEGGNNGNNGNGSVRDIVNTEPDNEADNGSNGGNQT
ncbi:uncharacterized protein [Ptychodera flava]|uniref:uncharacterized protein n=1 Tax=Ptychodera flava TaxID=63121 RepID=UPI003969E9FB